MVVSKGSSSSRALTENVFGVLCQWLLMGGGRSLIRKVAPNGGWTVFIDADSLLKLSVVYAGIYHYMLIVGYFQTQWRPVIFTTTHSRWNY